MVQQLAGASGAAILIAAMSIGAARAAAEATAQATGTRSAFIVCGIIALVGVGIGPLIKRLPLAASAQTEAEKDWVSVNA